MEDQHVVQLGDVQITVGEDEPAKHAVETEISEIEVVHKGRPIREYFDKWRGNIDTRYAASILRGLWAAPAASPPAFVKCLVLIADCDADWWCNGAAGYPFHPFVVCQCHGWVPSSGEFPNQSRCVAS